MALSGGLLREIGYLTDMLSYSCGRVLWKQSCALSIRTATRYANQLMNHDAPLEHRRLQEHADVLRLAVSAT